MGIFTTTTKPRMVDYMPVRAGGMPDVGQGSGWTVASWFRARVEHVRLETLTATQQHLSERRLERYADGRKTRSDGQLPCVVATGGQLFIADGHHRVVAAMRRGETTLRAHVKRVDR